MISIDWSAMGMGAAVGLVTGAAFFAGLAYGMRIALRSKNTVGLLALSAALRIAVFLGVAWLVVTQGGPWAALGYAGAFFAARRVAMVLARAGLPDATVTDKRVTDMGAP